MHRFSLLVLLVIPAVALAATWHGTHVAGSTYSVVTEEPQIELIGVAVLDVPNAPVTGSCLNETVASVVSSAPYWHAASSTYRRNVGVSMNPPVSATTTTCEVLDDTTVVWTFTLAFTGDVAYPEVEIAF